VPEATGRPAYHPATMLKIYVYGYINQIQSSRRLERETARNVEMMWLIAILEVQPFIRGNACPYFPIWTGRLRQWALSANLIGVAPRPRSFNRCRRGEYVAVGVAPADEMHTDWKTAAQAGWH
jgi:Transposase domain (DUF772)